MSDNWVKAPYLEYAKWNIIKSSLPLHIMLNKSFRVDTTLTSEQGLKNEAIHIPSKY